MKRNNKQIVMIPIPEGNTPKKKLLEWIMLAELKKLHSPKVTPRHLAPVILYPTYNVNEWGFDETTRNAFTSARYLAERLGQAFAVHPVIYSDFKNKKTVAETFWKNLYELIDYKEITVFVIVPKSQIKPLFDSYEFRNFLERFSLTFDVAEGIREKYQETHLSETTSGFLSMLKICWGKYGRKNKGWQMESKHIVSRYRFRMTELPEEFFPDGCSSGGELGDTYGKVLALTLSYMRLLAYRNRKSNIVKMGEILEKLKKLPIQYSRKKAS